MRFESCSPMYNELQMRRGHCLLALHFILAQLDYSIISSCTSSNLIVVLGTTFRLFTATYFRSIRRHRGNLL